MVWQGGFVGYYYGIDVGSLKDLECSVGKEIGDFGDFVVKVQIWFVRVVVIYCFVLGDVR